jgi:hypothetical protein
MDGMLIRLGVLLVVFACSIVYAVVQIGRLSAQQTEHRWPVYVIDQRLALAPPAHGPTGPGSFTSNDELLNRVWQASADTASDMLVRGGGLWEDALRRPCRIDVAVALVDGFVRDRCPYIGDQSVTGLALDVSNPHFAVQEKMLEWYASAQHADGAIPASPLSGGILVLFDYNAYWLESLYAYALHSGDVAFVRRMWPHVERLVGWYAAQTIRTGPNSGLLVNELGPNDYAFLGRDGSIVSYFNAQYVVALEHAARMATWIGRSSAAAAWKARAQSVRAVFRQAFWDPRAGAFKDTSVDAATHPQDGNAFAILAGLATGAQARSALAYLTERNARPDGNTFVDSDRWNRAEWGHDATERIYPFISFYETLARFRSDLDGSALDLIRREWGYMVTHGPRSTLWESYNAETGRPEFGLQASWDHGWSAGAGPALTEYVLGVQPTSPGYATFTVVPHVGNLTTARGRVPTPHGPISISWTVQGKTLSLHVSAPSGTAWTGCRTLLALAGRNGLAVSSQGSRSSCR